jgi:hypothetical protein
VTTFSPLRAALAAALTLLAFAAPASAQAPVPAQPSTGADFVASDNVEHIGSLKTVGDGVGATIIPELKRMFVTSTQGLNVFDISDAANPKEIGSAIFNLQFENEEVPTNGKILGISSDTYCVVVGVPPAAGSAADGGCLAIYDVSNPAAIKLLANVPGAGNHTSACILDCQYMYGDGGTITDLRDPSKAKIVGDTSTDNSWIQASGIDLQKGCHHVREVAPGIILGSCQPVILMSVRPEHGGSPLKPVILATGVNADNRFIHSSRWPNKGRDKFALVGGEENFNPQCSDELSAFMTWDATKVLAPNGGWNFKSAFTMIDEVRPENGTYADGKTPYQALGCSVHWFMEHPSFKNGGLVALAEYENGTRFLQIAPNGKITEQGYFLPLGGSASAPHWNPDGSGVLYTVDYTRGVEILRWKGDTYVPNADGTVTPTPGATPGTNGARIDAPACASAAGFRSTRAKGAGRGVDVAVDKRADRPYAVDFFQVSSGRSVVRERLVRRFTDVQGNLRWDGKDRKGRKLTDGFYFARLKMKLADGSTDTRRLTLRRKGGKFSAFSDFYQRTDCGVFRSFKLGSAAFGGRKNTPLTGAYRLTTQAKSVKIEAIAGSKVVKTIKGGTAKGKTFRFSIPAKLAKRGQTLKIRVTVQGSRRTVQTLASTRV